MGARKTRDGEVSFEERDGVLYRMFRGPDGNGEKFLRQVMVPQTLQQQVMNDAHNSNLGGHLGVKKTTDKITAHFYWHPRRYHSILPVVRYMPTNSSQGKCFESNH